MAIFQRVGTRWMFPAMGGTPYGLRWEAIFPMMDRLDLSSAEWEDLHDDLQVMERSAIETIREFAPRGKT